ncbi:MAG: PIN/TRAM domain-containing protein [Pirellulaceae bacterium]|nr:PIN/TRAM domain-containing protein [Pirellulaceae bacterium]
MTLWVLRAAYLLVSMGVAVLLFSHLHVEKAENPFVPWLVLFGTIVLVVGVIFLDLRLKKQIEIISSVYGGLLVGALLTYIVSIVLAPLYVSLGASEGAKAGVLLVVGPMICYGCISLLLQTRGDFRFIIPYVEFVREVKGFSPFLLDTSVVIDGRIIDLVKTNAFDHQFIMPRFVLRELQAIADSNDKMRRDRGRRGLEILSKLQEDPDIDLQIYEHEMAELKGQPVDMKLVILAKHLEGKLVTGDYNLNQVAKLHSVAVVNLNEIANALKPNFLPGEDVQVRIVKPGEEATQGVGYLEDGTMVVVEGARDYVHKLVQTTVTSVIQTHAGRMIFARFERELTE